MKLILIIRFKCSIRMCRLQLSSPSKRTKDGQPTCAAPQSVPSLHSPFLSLPVPSLTQVTNKIYRCSQCRLLPDLSQHCHQRLSSLQICHFLGLALRSLDWTTLPHLDSVHSQTCASYLHFSGSIYTDCDCSFVNCSANRVIVSLFSFFSKNRALKILLLIIVFGLAVIAITMAVMYRNALRLQGIFLDYSRRFLVEKNSTFLYIPIFMILTAGLFALFIFQHAAFSSKQHSNRNFYDFSNPGLLGWLNIMEFIWGLQFLRDACK